MVQAEEGSVIPYEAPLIARLLRGFSAPALATATPTTFQTWPAAVVCKPSAINELIANERARRAP